MTDLERLIKAEGVKGGVLADYEKGFRRFVDVRLGNLGAKGLGQLASDLMRVADFCGDKEIYRLARLASKASIAHMQVERV